MADIKFHCNDVGDFMHGYLVRAFSYKEYCRAEQRGSNESEGFFTADRDRTLPTQQFCKSSVFAFVTGAVAAAGVGSGLYWFSQLLYHQIQVMEENTEHKYEVQIIRVLEYIHTHYGTKITIEYLNRYRCKKALELLEGT